MEADKSTSGRLVSHQNHNSDKSNDEHFAKTLGYEISVGGTRLFSFEDKMRKAINKTTTRSIDKAERYDEGSD